MKDAKGHGSEPRNGGAGAKPIPNHPYHTKTNAELRYIAKDASEAEHASRGMTAYNPNGSNRTDTNGKYADQLNDASTVLGYRNRGGLSDAPSDVASRTAVAGNSPKSAPVPVHDSMSDHVNQFADPAKARRDINQMVHGQGSEGGDRRLGESEAAYKGRSESSETGRTDAAGLKDKVYNMVKGMHTSRPDTSRY